ncbi:hypothetical protein BDV95DRAFT_569734 [Massariosphaeria phaeospora]|uniref:DUF1857-domain-containing protein n=1 Tax=Massariosphaeria phaeospora TaxID=100035 RepID=A0A7C8M9T4_9PLEO|nr:hypothetical protein BDV95DRAFT_569734 [Massariosphaeria phaeospora]
MVHLNLAHTEPINPAGTSITLTGAQIWTGLQRKIRFAQEFVPVIESCEVESDEGGVVIRRISIRPGVGPKSEARETVRCYWPSWVDFEQDDGTHIRNVISQGPSGEPTDLLMTYMFEYRLPEVEEGAQAEKELQRLKGLAKGAVEKTIETMREMVRDGRIKE